MSCRVYYTISCGFCKRKTQNKVKFRFWNFSGGFTEAAKEGGKFEKMKIGQEFG
jgi:hypothetical protein